VNHKRKSRRLFFLFMRRRTPPISSEFRGGLNPQNPHPLLTPLAQVIQWFHDLFSDTVYCRDYTALAKHLSMKDWGNDTDKGKGEIIGEKTCLPAVVSTTNRTGSGLGLNPGIRRESIFLTSVEELACFKFGSHYSLRKRSWCPLNRRLGEPHCRSAHFGEEKNILCLPPSA